MPFSSWFTPFSPLPYWLLYWAITPLLDISWYSPLLIFSMILADIHYFITHWHYAIIDSFRYWHYHCYADISLILIFSLRHWYYIGCSPLLIFHCHYAIIFIIHYCFHCHYILRHYALIYAIITPLLSLRYIRCRHWLFSIRRLLRHYYWYYCRFLTLAFAFAIIFHWYFISLILLIFRYWFWYIS
jgi:hypothetical protein